MARGENTSNHPNRGVSRHKFAGGGYVDVLRSPELQRDIDAMTAYEKHEKENPELMADMDGGLDAHFPESAKLNPKGSY